MDELLAEENYLNAIPVILAAQREGDDIGDRYKQAIDGLKAKWTQVRDGNDWQQSLILLRSLVILGETEIINGITETDFFIKGARHYIDSGLLGAAAALVQARIKPEELPENVRNEFHNLFLDAGYSSLAATLNGQQTPEAPEIAPIIDGTVTVWVNKGFKLVGTVGVPDRSIGSAFFIDPQGYALTNYHVIQSEVDPGYKGYTRLFVKKDEKSGDRFPAKVVGWDENYDLALIKTEMGVPYVFNFAGLEIPKLGDRISAIGSPGGLAKTLTSGTVSAYARTIQPMSGSLQIDVPINPGNSGGPLLNSHGEVIGVVFAGVREFESINFAIPSNYALLLIPSLYDGGSVDLPWLGACGWDNFGEIYISYVTPQSPAYIAGLRKGDLLNKVDGKEFHTIRTVQEYLTTCFPSTLSTLEWKRDGTPMTGLASLGIRPEIPLKAAMSIDARENLLEPLFGFSVERISGWSFYQSYRITSVLQGSIADEGGFSAGDVFTLRRWTYIREDIDAVFIQLIIKGKKAGFLEAAIQIGAPLNVSTAF